MKKFGLLYKSYDSVKNFFRGDNLIELYKKSKTSVINGLKNFMDEINSKISSFTMKTLGYDFSSTYDSTIEDGWTCSKNLITVKWDRINLKWLFFNDKEELTFIDFAFKCTKTKHICNPFIGKFYNYKFSDEKLKIALQKLKNYVDKKITESDFNKILDSFKSLNSDNKGRKLGAFAVPALALAATSSLLAILGRAGVTKTLKKGESYEINNQNWEELKGGVMYSTSGYPINTSAPNINKANEMIQKEKEESNPNKEIDKKPLINNYHPPSKEFPDNMVKDKNVDLNSLEYYILIINTLYYHQIFRLCDDINFFLANLGANSNNMQKNTFTESSKELLKNETENIDMLTNSKILKNYYWKNINLDRLNYFINVETHVNTLIFNAALELSFHTSFSNNRNNNIFSLKDNSIFSTFKRLIPSLKKIIPLKNENSNETIRAKFVQKDKKFLFLANHENIAFWFYVMIRYFKSIEQIYEEHLKYIAFVEAISYAADQTKIKNSYLFFNISIILTTLINFKNLRKIFTDKISNEILNNFKNNSDVKKHIFISEDELIPEIQWNSIEEKNYLNMEIIKRYYCFLTDPCILDLNAWGLTLEKDNNLSLIKGDLELDTYPWNIDGFEKSMDYKYYSNNQNNNNQKIEEEKNPLIIPPIPTCVKICDDDKKNYENNEIEKETENEKLFQNFFLDFNFDDWCKFVHISRSLDNKEDFDKDQLKNSSFIEIYVLNYERTNGWLMHNISKGLSSYLLLKDLKVLLNRRIVYEENIEDLFENLSYIFESLSKEFCKYLLEKELAPYLKKEFNLVLYSNHPILELIKIYPNETSNFFAEKLNAQIHLYDATNGEDELDFYVFEKIDIIS